MKNKRYYVIVSARKVTGGGRIGSPDVQGIA